MLKLSDEQARTFRDAVAIAQTRADLQARVTALYADVQRQIDLRKPRCDVSGRCCRFEEFGHRLFVTTLEVGAFVEGLDPDDTRHVDPGGGGSDSAGVGVGEQTGARTGGTRTQTHKTLTRTHKTLTLALSRGYTGEGTGAEQGTGAERGCRYQVGGLCGVHAIRPFGCRIFFCDPTATDWQQAQYEHFHLRLRQMHEQMGVPYLYVEWREALRAMSQRT